MKKRWTSVLLVLCLLFSTASAVAVGMTSDGVVQTKELFIAFPSTGGQGDIEEMVTYSDAYFAKNSLTYHHDLAKLSLGFALAGFRSTDGGTERYDTKHRNIESAMQQAGFTNLRFDAYHTKPTATSIASAIGRKTVMDAMGRTKTVVSVVVSGGGYEAEWAGNFQIATDEGTLSEDHGGFASAASEVLSRVDAYLTQTETKGEVIYWVTGYSRAAAVSNLVGAALNARVGAKNVFAYTFATPTTTTNSITDTAANNKNIFNIIHYGDLVTMLPLETWGYGRYGLDLYFRSETSQTKYAENQAFLTKVNALIGGREAYYKNGYQKLLMAYFEQQYGKAAANKSAVILAGLPEPQVTHTSLGGMGSTIYSLYALLNTLNFSEIGAAHAPELYLSMMRAGEPSALKTEALFSDVSKDAFYYDAVQWAVEKGITEGTGNTTFSPALTATRAQAVTFLWRAKGSPKPTLTHNPFQDISSNDYYYNAVLWAVEQGIVKGITADTFEPNGKVTRSQTVTLQWRLAGSPQAKSSNPFEDVTEKDYFYDAVLWATQNGITNGMSSTAFQPGGECNRAQLVTFLFRQLS